MLWIKYPNLNIVTYIWKFSLLLVKLMEGKLASCSLRETHDAFTKSSTILFRSTCNYSITTTFSLWKAQVFFGSRFFSRIGEIWSNAKFLLSNNNTIIRKTILSLLRCVEIIWILFWTNWILSFMLIQPIIILFIFDRSR